MAAELGLSADQVTEAWVYLLGRYLVMRQERIDLAEDGVDFNVLKHNPAIVVGTDSGAAPTFVNPNLDVVYSEAWIAVDADTPAILEIPEVPQGRYYTAQIVDEWAEITHNINERNFPDHPHGRYALCLAGSSPVIPDGCLRVDLPSGKAKLLTRVELGDDVEGAVALQHQFSLSSTGTPDVRALRTSPSSTTHTCRVHGSSSRSTSRPRSRRPMPAAEHRSCNRWSDRSAPGSRRTPAGSPTSTRPSTRAPSRASCTSS